MKRADPEKLDRIANGISRPIRMLGASLLIGVTGAVVSFFFVPRATAEAFAYLLALGAVFLFVMRAIAREPAAVSALRSVTLPVTSPRPIVAAGLIGVMLIGAGLQDLAAHAFGLLQSSDHALLRLTRVELALLLPAVLVFAPIAEELVFRYALQRRLQRHVNATLAVVLTSTLFAALHGLNPARFGAMFVLGCAAGALAATPGYVALPVALHLGWNLAAFVGMAVQ